MGNKRKQSKEAGKFQVLRTLQVSKRTAIATEFIRFTFSRNSFYALDYCIDCFELLRLDKHDSSYIVVYRKWPEGKRRMLRVISEGKVGVNT